VLNVLANWLKDPNLLCSLKQTLLHAPVSTKRESSYQVLTWCAAASSKWSCQTQTQFSCNHIRCHSLTHSNIHTSRRSLKTSPCAHIPVHAQCDLVKTYRLQVIPCVNVSCRDSLTAHQPPFTVTFSEHLPVLRSSFWGSPGLVVSFQCHTLSHTSVLFTVHG